MSKTKKGSNAQFTGAGKGLTIMGNHCYGYSGQIGADNNEKDMLAFTTGKGYIKCKIQFTSDAGTSDDLRFRVYINEVQLTGQQFTDTRQNTFVVLENVMIPPLSYVRITAFNSSSANARDCYAHLGGEVYG